MKNKLVIILSTVVVILVCALLAVPFGMGLWISNRYPQLIKEFNTPHVSFSIINFKRGWFRSYAQLQVTLHSAETTLSGESIPLAQFVITQHIEHGPLVRQKYPDGVRHWLIAFAAMQNETHSDNLIFKANTLWTRANSINTTLDIGHLLLSNDHQRVEINNLNGEIVYSPADKHFQSHLNLGNGALYENNPQKAGNNIIDLVKVMELNNFTTRLDVHRLNSLWYGNRHFEAQKVMIYPSNGTVLTAENDVMDLNQYQQNGVTNFNLTNHVDAITGDQFKVTALQFGLELQNMNTGLLENFAQIFMYGSDFQRFKLYTILLDLFTKGMTVNLNQFQFNTEDGPVGVQAQIASAPIDPAHQGLLHLFENLNVKATANVPKEWLKKSLASYYESKKAENPKLKFDSAIMAQNDIEHLMQQKLLVPVDQQVSLILDYKDGKLLINGEKPTLDGLINDSLSGKQ